MKIRRVVICWKIRIFAYWTTPRCSCWSQRTPLWFAEKFVSLLIEQHHDGLRGVQAVSCDLLKNSYLCLLNNTLLLKSPQLPLLWFAEKFVSLLIEQHLTTSALLQCGVVICWKIRIFAYWTTPRKHSHNILIRLWFAEKFVSLLIEQHPQKPVPLLERRCDLLKNSYLCLLNNTFLVEFETIVFVVICWKIRIFA